TIASVDSGGISAFTPAIIGNLTVSGTSTSIAIKNVGINQTITHSSSGSLFLTDLSLGQSTNIGTLNKTGSGYLSIQNCNLGIFSGLTLTNVNITGPGSVVFNNTQLAAVTVNNASAIVSIVNNSNTLSVTLTAGTLNVFDSYMYTLGNSGFYAVNATGGVLQIRNSILINPNMTPARVNLTSPTVFAYDDIYFDRAGSTLGVSANSVVDFQSIRLSGALSVTGNITGGNILTAGLISTTGNITGNYILGNGSQLTGLPATYGNANVTTLLAAYGSNTISTTGNITAGNLIGNISITGNVTGTSANVQLVAGAYTWTFDNTGNVTLPTSGDIIMPGINSILSVSGTTLLGGYSQVAGYYSTLGVKYPGAGTQHGMTLQPTT
ncbi:MAG: hypothetical protein EBU90_30985, partial [Proteobacteria bacterium]|nr:hypothetical protein [Pseudomonadota bacterium]